MVFTIADGNKRSMSLTGLTPDQLALLQQAFKKHPEVDAVKLYGSRAKGNFHERSDVDLVLIGTDLVINETSISVCGGCSRGASFEFKLFSKITCNATTITNAQNIAIYATISAM